MYGGGVSKMFEVSNKKDTNLSKFEKAFKENLCFWILEKTDSKGTKTSLKQVCDVNE